jgi:ABC-type transport system substrate-binding protein
VPWFTTAQIGNWNEPSWSNAEYDRLSDEQISAMEPQQRAEMIWRMQELMYEAAVYPVLAYPYRLQAYDTDGWEGWTPLGYGGRGGGAGPVFYTTQNVETYLNLSPTDETGDGGGGSRWIVAVIAIGVAAIVVGLLVWLAIGRRSGREETVE